MATIAVLIAWISLSQFMYDVDTTVITVNNDGDISVECCVNGTCSCSSLYYTLQNLTSNSIINITSESVTLHTTTPIGSGNLHNITITGNGATIMCNNSGGAYCESCSDVIIEGITWEECYTSPLLFSTLSISVTNCIFQYSSSVISDQYKAHGNHSLYICNGTFLARDIHADANNIWLELTLTSGNLDVIVDNSTFTGIGVLFETNGYDQEVSMSLTVLSSKFSNNSAVHIHCDYCLTASIYVFSTIFQQCWSVDYSALLIDFNPVTTTKITILNTQFINNANTALDVHMVGNSSTVTVNDVLFFGNEGNHIMHGCAVIVADISGHGIVDIHRTNFTSNKYHELDNGILTIMSVIDNTMDCTFTQCAFVNNTESVLSISTAIVKTFSISFRECTFVNNVNSVLIITTVFGAFECEFTRCNFVNNTSPDHGAAIHMFTHSNSATVLSECSFDYNIGQTVVYINDALQRNVSHLLLTSSNFTNNIGTALYITSYKLELQSHNLFQNNYGENGAAIYFNVNSRITLQDPAIQLINNTAKFRGGAIYADVTNDSSFCASDIRQIYNSYKNSENYSIVLFDGNSARYAGNDVYFNFHRSCEEAIFYNTTYNVTAMYGLDKINFTRHKDAVATSPYRVNVCSKVSCDISKDSCTIDGPNMPGPLYFNVTLCDCYDQVSAELLQFQVSCINCNSTYEIRNHQVFVRSGTEMITIAKLKDDEDFTLKLNVSSFFSLEVKNLAATLSVRMSACFSGFEYSSVSKICECYQDNDDVIKCRREGTNAYAEIKQGYWFGNFLGKHTVALCPNFYCDFSHRTETRNGYYNLPRKLDDQCRPHRTGVACGDCSSGYTLAYNAPDCVDERKCSWMLPLVIVLTILYWIVIVVGVCGLMHSKFQISLGHLYGIIYFYSIVDVLLGNNLYISDGVFQLVAVISSFAKLTPQIIGKLCFVKGLSGIDQQFINYIHVIAVSLIIFGITKVAKYSTRIAIIGERFIIRAVCVLLLLSYTSLAATSIQLLRVIYFNDVDGIFCYTSPTVKIYSGRHLAYGIVAMFCATAFVVLFPFLLLFEPILKRRFNFIRIKPIIDQFQGSYKDKYYWFASFYLICRLVIFVIAYVYGGNLSNRLYYLQTICIVIVLIHGWIQPYKSRLLNMLDITILLNMVLLVNLTTFNFSEPATISISVVLILLPLCLYFIVFAVIPLISWVREWRKQYHITSDNTENDR